MLWKGLANAPTEAAQASAYYTRTRPSLSFHYTISEDRCGSNEDVASTILSRLGERKSSNVLEARRESRKSDASKILARLGEGRGHDTEADNVIHLSSSDTKEDDSASSVSTTPSSSSEVSARFNVDCFARVRGG